MSFIFINLSLNTLSYLKSDKYQLIIFIIITSVYMYVVKSCINVSIRPINVLALPSYYSYE